MKLLSKEEEDALVKAAQAGDKAAMGRLWESVLPFARSLVYRYIRRGHGEFDDLLQTAAEYFMVAVKKHKPNRGARLLTFAGSWMTAYVSRRCKTEAKRDRSIEPLSTDFTFESEDSDESSMAWLPEELTCSQEAILERLERGRVQKRILRLAKRDLAASHFEVIKRVVMGEYAEETKLAKELGLSRQGICHRKATGMNLLRTRLKQKHPELWSNYAVI
jgi:RNA polymerase sigma factor (sigma-70 family)